MVNTMVLTAISARSAVVAIALVAMAAPLPALSAEEAGGTSAPAIIDKLLKQPPVGDGVRDKQVQQLVKEKLLNDYWHIFIADPTGNKLIFQAYVANDGDWANGEHAFAEMEGKMVEIPTDLSQFKDKSRADRIMVLRFDHGMKLHSATLDPPFKNASFAMTFSPTTGLPAEYIGAKHYVIGASGYPEVMIDKEGTRHECKSPIYGLHAETTDTDEYEVTGIFLPNFTFIHPSEVKFDISVKGGSIVKWTGTCIGLADGFSQAMEDEAHFSKCLGSSWGITSSDFGALLLAEAGAQRSAR